MIGRITVLGSATLFGVIKAENGLSVRFDHSAVMTYDLSGLALDRAVTFDIENGPNPRAINVCVRKDIAAPSPEKERHAPIHYRYMGFEQTALAREYRFDQVAIGAETLHLIVKIAMTLFTKHHVGIQDGPALCLHALNLESKSSGVPSQLEPTRSLDDSHAQTYVDSKAQAGASSSRRRQTRARTASLPA